MDEQALQRLCIILGSAGTFRIVFWAQPGGNLSSGLGSETGHNRKRAWHCLGGRGADLADLWTCSVAKMLTCYRMSALHSKFPVGRLRSSNALSTNCSTLHTWTNGDCCCVQTSVCEAPAGQDIEKRIKLASDYVYLSIHSRFYIILYK